MVDSLDISVLAGPEFTLSIVDVSKNADAFTVSITNPIVAPNLNLQSPSGFDVSIECVEILTEQLSDIDVSSTPLILELKPVTEVLSLSVGFGTPTTIINNGGSLEDTYETISSNLRAEDGVLVYTSGVLTSVIYTDGVVKTLTYVSGQITKVTLSGAPVGVTNIVKTLTYNMGGDLIGFSYGVV